jgi:xanthine/CO dehydrogenase XdhC/CoxF family maturation factor
MENADLDILERAAAWLAEGRGVALATVIDTWGSSPRPRGSQLALRDDGEFIGSVSGGCVEGKVIEIAREILRGAPPRVLEFGVSDEEAWGVGLACGGTVRIFVDAVASVDPPDGATAGSGQEPA